MIIITEKKNARRKLTWALHVGKQTEYKLCCCTISRTCCVIYWWADQWLSRPMTVQIIRYRPGWLYQCVRCKQCHDQPTELAGYMLSKWRVSTIYQLFRNYTVLYIHAGQPFGKCELVWEAAVRITIFGLDIIVGPSIPSSPTPNEASGVSPAEESWNC